jgi:hypothetical protein
MHETILKLGKELGLMMNTALREHGLDAPWRMPRPIGDITALSAPIRRIGKPIVPGRRDGWWQ